MCHVSWTNDETKRVILENIHRSPLYGGQIEGIGPRYCPSIEDKVVRFPDKPRHQLFIEPCGLDTEEDVFAGDEQLLARGRAGGLLPHHPRLGARPDHAHGLRH